MKTSDQIGFVIAGTLVLAVLIWLGLPYPFLRIFAVTGGIVVLVGVTKHA